VTTLEPQLALAVADLAQIEMTVVNLSLNARDATTRGGILRIDTGNVVVPGALTPGEYVRLSISDTGKGMPPEVRAPNPLEKAVDSV
jgi:signal transduction histidine kinase